MVVRAWAPVGAVVVALPVSASLAPGDLAAARIADLAFLAALREAAGGVAASVEAVRTRTGRYFVATARPEDLADVLGVMRRVAGGPLPHGHVESAMARAFEVREFREGSPQDRFEQLFAARLSAAGPGGLGLADEPADPVDESARDSASAAATASAVGAATDEAPSAALLEAASAAPATAWGMPAWVVVADGPRPGLPSPVGGPVGPPETDSPPFVLPSGHGTTAPAGLVSVAQPAEVVTTWVGLAFELAPGTTLQQADFLRALLALRTERRLDDTVYGFSAEVGPAGRLLVQFSASPEAARAWEARIAETLAAPTLDGLGRGPAALLRAARSKRSQAVADPAVAAATAADALLRGATPAQVLALVRGGPAPSPEEVARVGRTARLVLRVEYGAPAR